MASLGTAVLDLVTNNDALQSGLDAGLSAAKNFGVLAAGAVAAVSAAAIGVGIAAVNLGNEFDSAFDAIRIGTGATGDALKGLQSDFKNVLGTVPEDIGTVGQVLADLNTRTGQSGESLQELTKTVLDLSRITGTDATASVASLTRVFGDWGVATDDQTAALDKLFRASQATGPSVDRLASTVVAFGAPLRSMGFSFEQSLAMLGKFEKEGVNTELVIGSMRQALGKFAKSGEEPAEAFRRTIDTIAGMESVADATGLAMELFGARAGPDMAAAIREGKFNFDDLVDSIENGGDTISGLAGETADFAEKWGVFMNRAKIAVEPFASAMFSIGGIVLDSLTPAMEAGLTTLAPFSDALAGIVTLFTSTDLDATTEAYAQIFNVFGEDTARTILLVSQAVTGLFGAFQGDTAGMEQAQRALNELFGPEVISTAQQVGTAIKGAFDQIVGALSPFVTQQDLVVAGIIAISAVIVATAVPALISLVASAAPVVLAIGAIVAIVALARTAWENDWGGIQEKTQAVFEAIGPIFNAVIAYLGEQLTPLIEALGPAWEAIWPAMQQAFETWWSVVSPIFETVKNVLSIVIPLALVTLKTTFENQIKLITTALELVPPAIDLIQTAFQAVADFINGLHISNPFDAIIKAAERAKALIGGGGGGTPSFDGGTGAGVGTRAEGGPVSAGLPYLVGENGPELFTPNGNGSITPNGALGGIQVGSYQQVLNVGPGADFDAVRQAAADGFAEGMRRLIASARSRQVVPEGA